MNWKQKIEREVMKLLKESNGHRLEKNIIKEVSKKLSEPEYILIEVINDLIEKYQVYREWEIGHAVIHIDTSLMTREYKKGDDKK